MAKTERKALVNENRVPLTNKRKREKTKIELLNDLPTREFEHQFLPYASIDVPSGKDGDVHQLNLTYKSARELSNNDLDLCLNLIESTSRHDYKRSSTGWHPRQKKREMSETDMRYIIVNCKSPACQAQMDEGKQSHGFLSFMLTYDSTPSLPVLYIYEIHLPVEHRGQGTGRRLVQIVEDIAAKADIKKVMLTCFLSNERAHGFYRSLDYDTDACSPTDRKIRNKVVKADYVIMSKRIGNLSKKRRIEPSKVFSTDSTKSGQRDPQEADET